MWWQNRRRLKRRYQSSQSSKSPGLRSVEALQLTLLKDMVITPRSKADSNAKLYLLAPGVLAVLAVLAELDIERLSKNRGYNAVTLCCVDKALSNRDGVVAMVYQSICILSVPSVTCFLSTSTFYADAWEFRLNSVL